MIRGRLWRFLLAFVALYLTFVLLFFRSSTSDEPQTTSPPASIQARVIHNDLEEPKNFPHHVAARDIETNGDEQNKPNVENSKRPRSDLEPFMTKGVLGNYESTNIVKASGPGEDGEGVQLQGEDIKLGEQSVAEYGFNEVASEKISLDRRARDTRYQRTREFCRGKDRSIVLDRRNANIGIIRVWTSCPPLQSFWFSMTKGGRR